MTEQWRVRDVDATEFAQWTTLFRGYCDFYDWPTSEDHQHQIWEWIHHDRVIEALVAVRLDEQGNERGELVGLAHLREWVRPLRGTRGGYLDDLYVAPESRGGGVVDALFDELVRRCRQREWTVLRWTTAPTNTRAQRVYDRVAERTSWITYDLTVPDVTTAGRPHPDGPVSPKEK